METVVQTPVEPELNLLTQWHGPADSDRRRRAAIATVIVHVAAISILFLLPESFFEQKRLTDTVERNITPIFEPLTKLTQKAPNSAQASKEFSVQQPQARRAPPAPAPTPVGPKPEPRQAVIPQPPPPPKPVTPLPEPPKVDALVKAPKIEEPQLGVIPPPPKLQAQETPKLPLENLNQGPPPVVPPDKRIIAIPDASPSAALRNLGGGSPRPPAPAQGTESDPSALQLPQLLTDPQGVDFAPYLRLILQIVKRNWQSVMPESVRMGQRGKVSIVFSIDREGQVPKMVIAESSGIHSFDEAAIEGISMSHPFPVLPPAFRGDKIVVQFNFAYNTPKK